MNTNKTEIVVALDASGSMGSIKEAMENGFKEYIESQKQQDGECVVSIYTFTNSWPEGEFIFSENCEELNINKVKTLGLNPSGGTPLRDGVCTAIDRVGDRLASKKEKDRPGRVIFLIVTDGHENASRIFSDEQLQEKIKHQTNKYKWTFVYLGANQDAFAAGTAYGIGGSFSKGNFKANTVGVSKMWENTGKMSSRKRGLSHDTYCMQAVNGEHYTPDELSDIENG